MPFRAGVRRGRAGSPGATERGATARQLQSSRIIPCSSVVLGARDATAGLLMKSRFHLETGQEPFSSV